MRYLEQILLLVLIIAIMAGCETVANMFTYKTTTVAFVENLLNEKYDEAVDQMAVDKEDFGRLIWIH